ncbi:MAG: ribonuclease E/G, partial [Pseudomonadota bacterium]
MAKKMLIDATHPEETRVVVMDGSKVDEFDFESLNKRQLAGNIYLAKVTRVEPSLQAAFVEYGGNRHGFLAFSEIHPDYYQIPVADREALIAAEEAAEADAAEDAEAKPEKEAKKPRSRRSRSRKKKDAAEAEPAAEAEAAAAEDAAPGDEPATAAEDAAPAEEATEAETASAGPEQAVEADEAEPEVAAVDEAEADEAVAEAAEANGDVEDQGADDNAEADDQADGDEPRSIAESAGAEEGESVSEPLDAPAEAADAPAAQAERAPDADERAVEDAPSTEAPTADETADAAEGTDEAAAEGAGGEDADGDRQRSKRSRGRSRGRGRKAKKQDGGEREEAETVEARADGEEPNDEDAKGEIESVGADAVEDEVRPRRVNHRRYKIQEVIKVRQILLVQVVKEERGNKGAALTTYLSLAGRYCVLMPNTARGGGISRKITNAADRKKLKEIAGELEVPKGMGLIIRTAGARRTKPEVRRDYEFLLRQWEQVREETMKSVAPALIYEEGSLIKRSIRDLYSGEIGQILVEGEAGFREARDYMAMLMPDHAGNVARHDEATPLFTRYQVESELSSMFNPVVQLKSGGYIVIGVTEALVAI